MDDLLGREAEYAMTEDARQALNTEAQLQHGHTQGLSMAAFVLGMWQGLKDSGLTRTETLALIRAALTGH